MTEIKGRSRRALIATLRRAARDLLPVAVDFGPSVPRLETFLDSVEEHGSGFSLVLSPIAANWIPVREALADRIEIRSTDATFPLVLEVGGLSARDARSARADLNGASLSLRPPDSVPPAGRGPEPLVAALSAGTDELVGYACPVREIGPDHCIIETSVALAPGKTFDSVELFGELRLLRQAPAEVAQTTPWITPDCTTRFRSRLLFGKAQLETRSRRYDVLTHPRSLLRILEMAAAAGVAIWADGTPGGPGRFRFSGCDALELAFAPCEPLPAIVAADTPLTIGFELFAISYEASVRVLRGQTGTLFTTLPLLLRRRRRRREPRVRMSGPKQAALSYRNPINGETEYRPLRDLSLGGLSMEMPAESAVWVGLTLENPVLHLEEGHKVPVGSACVRAKRRLDDRAIVAHLELAGIEDRRLDDLAAWLFARRFPELELHEGSEFRSILALYRRVGLLSGYMMRNLEAVAPNAAGNWRRMHRAGNEVARTFVRRPGGAAQGALTALHAWNRCWFAQHFGVEGNASSHLSGVLQLAYLEHLLTRREAHYWAFFVHAANARMNAFQDRFFALTGTPEVVSRASVDLWLCSAEGACPPEMPPGPVAPWRTRPVRGGETSLFCRAVERTLGRLPARALSFSPGELSLDHVRACFRKTGLERSRKAELVLSKGGVPAWGLAFEQASVGVNFTWMLNASWLFPIHTLDDPAAAALSAAMARILASPSPTPTGDRFLITVADTVSAASLERFGWRHELRANLYAFTRSGLHRFYHYLADRYGDLEIKTAARHLQRARREGA